MLSSVVELNFISAAIELGFGKFYLNLNLGLQELHFNLVFLFMVYCNLWDSLSCERVLF